MKNSLTFLYLTILGTSILFGQTDSYQLDVGHTFIGFDVERFLVGEVSGRFNECTAEIQLKGDDFTSLSVSTVIQVNSIDSNNETRDGHLQGPMWLDAASHPDIRFTSTSITGSAEEGYTMKGDFTIHGVSKEVSFPVVFSGPFKDPTQQTAIGMKADFSINRFDYGISFNKTLDSGDLLIGDEVKIKIRALAYKK